MQGSLMEKNTAVGESTLMRPNHASPGQNNSKQGQNFNVDESLITSNQIERTFNDASPFMPS